MTILLQDLIDTLDQQSKDDFAATGVIKLTIPHTDHLLVSDGAKSVRVTIDKTGEGFLYRSATTNENTQHQSKIYKRSDQIIAHQGTPLYLKSQIATDWRVIVEIDNSTSIFTDKRLVSGYQDEVSNIPDYDITNKVFISAIDLDGNANIAKVNPDNNKLEFDNLFSGVISYLVIL